MTVPCFFHCHDIGGCGLARNDCKALGTPKRNFKKPNNASVDRNRLVIKCMIGSNNSTSGSADRRNRNTTSNNSADDQQAFGVI